MDLETENRIAAILMREAAEMRRQAEKEGVLAYLRQSNARGRPNSRFLTATVLGVQQANRAVEVNEMWRVRQKELELDDRLKGRLKEESSSGQSQRDTRNHRRTTSKRHDGKESDASALCSSSKRGIQDCCSQDDESLRDEEMEEFLHSRMELTELLVAGPSVAEVQLGQGWMKLALIFLLPKTPWERRLKALQLGGEKDGNIMVFWVQISHLHLSLLYPRKRSHIIGRRNRRK